MSKQRHRRRSQGGTTPETKPQDGSGVAQFSVSEVAQFWMSVDKRFGSSTEHGYSLPLGAMNLTHRQLAEMASVSRVTVTKSLAHFRQQGLLQRIGDVEILSMTGISLFREQR